MPGLLLFDPHVAHRGIVVLLLPGPGLVGRPLFRGSVPALPFVRLLRHSGLLKTSICPPPSEGARSDEPRYGQRRRRGQFVTSEGTRVRTVGWMSVQERRGGSRG